VTTRVVAAEEALKELVAATRCGDKTAAEALRQALVRDDEDVAGHRRVAVAYMHAGLHRNAVAKQVACINAERRADRRLADDENLLVAMLLMLGDARSAATIGRGIVDIWPDYLAGWENLAFALTQIGEQAAAADAYRSVLDRVPGKLNAMDDLARCLGGLGRYDEAIAFGRRSLVAKAEAASALPRRWSMLPPFEPGARNATSSPTACGAPIRATSRPQSATPASPATSTRAGPVVSITTTPCRRPP